MLRMKVLINFQSFIFSLNAQITKLIEDSTSSRTNRNAIPEEKILEWLVENKVLSIALEGIYSLPPHFFDVIIVKITKVTSSLLISSLPQSSPQFVVKKAETEGLVNERLKCSLVLKKNDISIFWHKLFPAHEVLMWIKSWNRRIDG